MSINITDSVFQNVFNTIKIGNVDKKCVVEKGRSKIPLNIFQTWCYKELPDELKANVELIKQQNPEFKYFYFDDDMCREFIKQHFDSEVLYSYDKLIPGAYRADLWRYCVLYIHGGVYLDIKYKCLNGFKFIEVVDDECIVMDDPVSTGNIIVAIFNAFMVCMPRNMYLKRAIDNIVYNVKSNFYNMYKNMQLVQFPLSITGPICLGNCYNTHIILASKFKHINSCIEWNSRKIITACKKAKEVMDKNGKYLHYWILSDHKIIYKFPEINIDVVDVDVKKSEYVINEWYPLSVNNCAYKYNLPSFFEYNIKNVNGILRNNEIIFVSTEYQKSIVQELYNIQMRVCVFDLEFNMTKHTEPFRIKYNNVVAIQNYDLYIKIFYINNVEFVGENDMILRLNDGTAFKVDYKDIEKLKWYNVD